MNMLLRKVVVCVGVIASAGAVRAGPQAVIPEADRYIKLGTRLPELAPGEGGELRVVAEQQWCRDATYVLEVRLLSASGFKPVVRLPAGPSDCAWLFERMPVGRYDALILAPRNERIVANGQGSLSKGASALLTAKSAQTDIEGRLTSQQALPSPLRLKFSLPDGKSWGARVSPDGSYRVTLGDTGDRASVAISAEADGPLESEPTSGMNTFPLKSTTIWRGLVRLDLDDVVLPPVVVHVEVPPIADARGDEFAETMLDDKRGPGFKLLRGFRGQFLATYGEHTVRIWTNDRQHLLAMKVVNVTPAETESRVLLEIRGR
jgi:hypothetical protein